MSILALIAIAVTVYTLIRNFKFKPDGSRQYTVLAKLKVILWYVIVIGKIILILALVVIFIICLFGGWIL